MTSVTSVTKMTLDVGVEDDFGVDDEGDDFGVEDDFDVGVDSRRASCKSAI